MPAPRHKLPAPLDGDSPALTSRRGELDLLVHAVHEETSGSPTTAAASRISHDDSVHQYRRRRGVCEAAAARERWLAMATAAPSESTPQRLAAIREQMKLLADYL